MNKNKKLIIIGLILLLFIGIAFTVFNQNKNPKEEEVIVEPIKEDPIEEVDPYEEVKKLWQENKAINEDYVGELIFESGLINTSFVQATSCYQKDGSPYRFFNEDGSVAKNLDDYTGNDVYIWMNWKTMEYDRLENGGSVFMDYRNLINDQNIIIYGHHFSSWNDPTHSIAFTPLEQLLEEKNYQNNKKLDIVLEKEIRHYELAVVYSYDATKDFYNDNCQYYRVEYDKDFWGNDDEGYYQNYIDSIYSARLYDTDVQLEVADKTLTLQTCISGYTGVRYEIVVFKYISSEYFSN